MPITTYRKKVKPLIRPIEIDTDFNTLDSCNYCVNHWGVDLCACGSGKKVNKCKEGLRECGTPMQDINVLLCCLQ